MNEWIKRCAARYKERAGLTDEQAFDAAFAAWEVEQEMKNGDTPEEAADEDMACWTDDGE